MPSCVTLFAREPVPGQVKTRLQPHLTGEAAASLYRASLLDCAATVAAARVNQRVVACSPPSAIGCLRQLLEPVGDFEYVEQAAGDLGKRMAKALASSLQAGAARAVLVGSDCPAMTPADIEAAADMLTRADVVIGPSTDGGYYLVGMRRLEAELFRHIEWSTGAVLEQTVAALRPDARLALLPPLYDVDTPADAALLRAHLRALWRAGEERAPHSLAALRGLDLPPPS